MNYIYKLEIINSKIDKLSLFKKLELYLIPLFIMCSIFLITPTSSSTSLLSLEKNIFELNNKKLDKTFLAFVKKYTNYINKNNIILENIKIENNLINLKIKSSLYKILKFMFFIESNNSFSSFISYKISKSEKLFELKLYINYKNFYIKNINHDIETKLEFLNKEQLKIDAYVGEFICINGQWLKVGKEVNSLKLIKVDSNYAYFQKNQKIIKVLKNAKFK